MKVTLRERRPERQNRPHALGLHASESLLHVAGGRRRISSFVTSTILHAASIPLLILSAELFAPAPAWKPQFPARMVIIRMPPRLYVPTVDPGTEVEPQTGEAKRLIAMLGAQNAIRTGSPTPANPVADRILIQPRFPKDMQPPPTAPPVPSAVALSSTRSVVPSKPEITPGPVKHPRTREMPQRPAETDTTAGITHNSLDVPQVIRRDTMPAQVLKAVIPSATNRESTLRQSSAETDPLELISVSPDPSPRQTFVLPPGNMVPSSLAPWMFSGPRIPGMETGTHTGANSFTSTSSSNGVAAANGSASKANDNVAIAATSQALAVAPVGQLADVDRDVGSLRIEHPVNGHFDVVVVQTSLADTLPATAGIMKGKPVYSVYLGVGDTKEWILHYCAAAAGIVQRGAIVQLPDPTPLTAPYPAVTVRPTTPVTGAESYLLVHGTVDESGMFRNLKVIGQGESSRPELFSTLGMWRFRPASRKNAPVAVEIVLAIPINKT